MRINNPTDAVIFDFLALYVPGFIKITPIKDHRSLHRSLQRGPTRTAVRLPLRDDDQRIGTLHGFHGLVHKLELLQQGGGIGQVQRQYAAGLINGHAAAVEQVNLGLVKVEAKHVVAQVGQAGAGDQAYVAGADDGDVHLFIVVAKVGRNF